MTTGRGKHPRPATRPGSRPPAPPPAPAEHRRHPHAAPPPSATGLPRRGQPFSAEAAASAYLKAALTRAIEEERGSLGPEASDASDLSTGEALSVVFLCTGNRARSPVAEALFRRRVEGLPVNVSSYGTLDLGSKPVLPEALAAASSLGVDLAAHRSRVILPGLLAGADLVVGFEPVHLATAVEVGEADPERAFVLLELPDVLPRLAPPGASELERARTVVRGMAERRQAEPAGHELPSLLDPYGDTRQAFAEMARVIDAITGLLAERLFPGAFAH